MTITITTPGDPSVGINGHYITVEWEGLEQLFEGAGAVSDAESEGYREQIRARLKTSFEELLDERVRVSFSDQCDGCGQKTCRCPLPEGGR